MIRNIIICLFWLSHTALAEPVASIPDVHVGDVWQYQISDGFTNEVLRSPTRKIVAITDTEITAEITFKGMPRQSPTLYFFTREENLKDNGTKVDKPFFPEFKFPMSLGDSWSKEFETTDIYSRSYKSFLKAKVTAYEKVQVPAGEFDAYRIDCQIDMTDLGENSRTMHDTLTVWYAPKVNSFIRREFTRVSEGRVRMKDTTELVEYKPHIEN
jgi:hypothetical protein